MAINKNLHGIIHTSIEVVRGARKALRADMSRGAMESVVATPASALGGSGGGGSSGTNGGRQHATDRCKSFQMPLHYPRFTRADYEAMPEWKLDSLLREYGLPTIGDLHYKRNFAIGCFLWPN